VKTGGRIIEGVKGDEISPFGVNDYAKLFHNNITHIHMALNDYAKFNKSANYVSPRCDSQAVSGTPTCQLTARAATNNQSDSRFR
jgi:hypothetical protein